MPSLISRVRSERAVLYSCVHHMSGPSRLTHKVSATYACTEGAAVNAAHFQEISDIYTYFYPIIETLALEERRLHLFELYPIYIIGIILPFQRPLLVQ